jgi:hypothetical protein
VRFPKPDKPVRVTIQKRDENNVFVPVWSVDIDTDAQDVIRKQPRAIAKPVPIIVNGPSPEKVDLLILGDGYSATEMKKFIADARRLSAHLLRFHHLKNVPKTLTSGQSPFQRATREFHALRPEYIMHLHSAHVTISLAVNAIFLQQIIAR